MASIHPFGNGPGAPQSTSEYYNVHTIKIKALREIAVSINSVHCYIPGFSVMFAVASAAIVLTSVGTSVVVVVCVIFVLFVV